jgi:hypothetical protein
MNMLGREEEEYVEIHHASFVCALPRASQKTSKYTPDV